MEHQRGTLEIERRYFEFDKDEVVQALLFLGGTHSGTFLFRQVAFLPRDRKVSLIRVRDEGHRITMTVKTKTNGPYFIEDEVVVDDFEKAVSLMTAIGLTQKNYVEKIRSIYLMGGAEIVFDEYPGLRAYIEIEAPNAKTLTDVAFCLGLRSDEAQGPCVQTMYLEEYGINRHRPTDALTFKSADGLVGARATKNREKFTAVLEAQRELIESFRKD
jgi:predicted adenylyl cyclase CyaB